MLQRLNEIHGMRAEENKSKKATQPKQREENAQKLLKSCQAHSWGFGRSRAVSGYVKQHPLHLPIRGKAQIEVLAV